MSFNASLPAARQHNFARITPPDVQRSVFDRSTVWKGTIDPGKLYPILLDEMLPADTASIGVTVFARINPMVVPPMDNLWLDTHAFFIPDRLVWSNFVKMMGEQANPDDSIDYVVPRVAPTSGGILQFGLQTLADYFGLPVDVGLPQTEDDEDIPVSALPFRAYNLVWNEWFRDQNYQDSVPVPLDDGPDPLSNYVLLARGKRHDYFTSSLPSPQKGPAVTISLAGSAPVYGTGDSLGLWNGTTYDDYRVLAFGNIDDAYALEAVDVGAVNVPAGTSHDGPSPDPFVTLGVTPNHALSGLRTNLTGVSVLSINEMRTALSVQHLLELYSRSGTRYTEILQNEFSVTPEDFRLQRPEFLGGSSQIIAMDAVPQTSAPTEDNAQASLASNGHVVSRLNFSYNVKEHGYLLILASVRADLNYQQGLRKLWSRRTRYDIFHPAFANLGEQAVLRKEFQVVDATTNPGFNNAVWGYQERFAEYRYFPGTITGKFRSIASQSLDAWHYALDYEGNPVQLDENFIKDTPQLRALAYLTEPAVFVDAFFGYRHARPMPVYSVPGLRRF